MKSLPLFTAVALIAVGASLNVIADERTGCREKFEQEVALLPTANAPTNAIGRVSLELEDEDGTNTLEFKLRVFGLPVSTYNVSVTDLTGTNAWDLGSFDVVSRPVCSRDDDDDFYSSTNTVSNTNTYTIGSTELLLAADLDPTNISYVYVFDTNGVVDMTADFSTLTNLTGIFYSKTVPVEACAATNAQGSATVTLSFKKGKTSSSFNLNVVGLSKQQNVSINANGVTKMKTSTNSKGSVSVKNLPKTNLGGLQTVDGRDKQGNKLFKADF